MPSIGQYSQPHSTSKTFTLGLFVAAIVMLAATILFADNTPLPPATAPAAASTAPAPSAKTEIPKPPYGKPITTDINPIQEVTYRTADTDLHALLITPKLPANTPTPSVILVHDIFGITAFTREQGQALARQGYTVLIPDLYTRIERAPAAKPLANASVSPAKEPDAQTLDANAAWIAYEKTPDQQVIRDLSASVEYLLGDAAREAKKPTADQPVGIVGFDMGGIYAMMIAGTDLRVAAAVNFYGRIIYANTSSNRPTSPVESLFNLRAPLLSFYGENDPQIPKDHVKALQSRLSYNPNKTFYEVIQYPAVGHGFMVPTREGYNKDAAEKASEKTKLFLARYLRAEPPKLEE